MKLPTLYKSTKTSAVQVCNISTTNDTYLVEWGQLDGTMQSKETTCYPKNVGKKNETTGAQQAEKEAQAKWVKKKDTGYSEDITAPITVKLPQKVKKWSELILTPKRLAALILPCWNEDKENGINGTYHLTDGELTLTSRGGNDFVVPAHHVAPIINVMEQFKLTKLNVEMLIDGYHLEDIQSAVTKHNDDTPLLAARIFEFPESPLTYTEKVPLKKEIQAYCEVKNILDAVSVVIPVKAHTMDELDKLYDDALLRKREGTIITNERSTYKYNTRSSDVWKRKPADDGEYKILSYVIDKNGHPVFTCEYMSTTGLDTFSVKPKGTDAQRKQIIVDFDRLYKHKFYKVEFELLSKIGKPTKPVGIALREVDSTGQPTI